MKSIHSRKKIKNSIVVTWSFGGKTYRKTCWRNLKDVPFCSQSPTAALPPSIVHALTLCLSTWKKKRQKKNFELRETIIFWEMYFHSIFIHFTSFLSQTNTDLAIMGGSRWVYVYVQYERMKMHFILLFQTVKIDQL